MKSPLKIEFPIEISLALIQRNPVFIPMIEKSLKVGIQKECVHSGVGIKTKLFIHVAKAKINSLIPT